MLSNGTLPTSTDLYIIRVVGSSRYNLILKCSMSVHIFFWRGLALVGIRVTQWYHHGTRIQSPEFDSTYLCALKLLTYKVASSWLITPLGRDRGIHWPKFVKCIFAKYCWLTPSRVFLLTRFHLLPIRGCFLDAKSFLSIFLTMLETLVLF